MSGRTVTWIHLSDLHALAPRTGWDARRVVQAVRTDLKALQGDYELHPDLLFFTGDLAFGQVGSGPGLNLKDQFDEGSRFLESVQNAFSPVIPKERTFIVPGNHDINRMVATPDQQQWLETLTDVDVVTTMIRDANRQWERYMERLHEYRAFLERHGYEHLLADPSRLIYAHDVDVQGVKVGVAGFNSAWSCSRNGEKGKLWVGGRWQAEQLHTQLEQADLRVALVHHPGGWYAEHEANPFWRHAIQRLFHFCLHGHEHDAWVDQLGSGHTVVAAGACYDRSDRPNANGFNVVRLDLDQGNGEVWLRKYDGRGGGWIPDVLHNVTDDRGVHALTNLPTVPAATARSPRALNSTARSLRSPKSKGAAGAANKTSWVTTTPAHLCGVIAGSNNPDPIVLLGGGASVRSGIPSSAELVERIARWAYCRSHARHPNDPTVKRSDWLPWLHKQSWYRRSASPTTNFAEAFDRLLQPREARIEFLRGISKPGVPASIGYQRFADLLAAGAMRTVLLALFDPVLADVCSARNRPHHVEVIRGPEDYVRISTSPQYPQLIYLHGALDRYAERSKLLDQDQNLDETLVSRLVPLLRDHPLIVIGYSGAEPALMRQLLIAQAEAAGGFRHGVFWCELADRVSDGLHPLVSELRAAIGPNLQLVPIPGFDELFDSFPAADLERIADTAANARRAADAVLPSPTRDMQLVTGATGEELDWVRVQIQLLEYCRRTDIDLPQPVTKRWLSETLCRLDLARPGKDSGITPTLAGYALFGKKPQERIPQSRVVVSVQGDDDVRLDGNLWVLLERITSELDEHNVPFLLKGAISEQVYPYPPLALREIVVNALVHRSYEGTQPTRVRVGPTSIEVTSPGGLVDQVRAALGREGLEIQERIEAGARGLKGYRNPVIADLFYGSGVMEKAGSGLADVQRLVKESGGKVVFGPTSANDRFDVTLYCRPEAVSTATGTATPLVSTAKFVSNLLEVVQLPSRVWHATTRARRAREIWEGTRAEHLPPFILHDGRLFCFSNPGTAPHPLRDQIDRGDLESLEIGEFGNTTEGEKRLVWLLHEGLYRHLEKREIAVDKKRKRAYFTRTEEGERLIKYQATVREATRTVAKPILARGGDRVRYWEHKGIRFGFERYGDTWALQLVPTYAFTVDGYYKRMEGHRVGPLTTRRSAHDYNLHVHNDLVFWAWVLASGQDSIRIDCGERADLILRSTFASYELRDVSPVATSAEADESEVAGLTLEEIEDRLAEQADRERSVGDDGLDREEGDDAKR